MSPQQLGILCALMLVGCIHSISGQVDEKSALKVILEDYEREGIHGRPVRNTSLPVNVDIVFALIKILAFDQQSQVITVIGRTTLQWDDEYLEWEGEPAEYSVPSDSIWTPDIHVNNLVDRPVDIHTTPLTVSSSGHVTWVRPQRLQLSCPSHADDLEPSCLIVFSSWTMDTQQMQLVAGRDRIDAGFYFPSNIWELSKTKAELSTRTYPVLGPKQFAQIEFTYSLKRRPQEDDDDDKDKMDSAGTVRASLVGALLAAGVVFWQNL